MAAGRDDTKPLEGDAQRQQVEASHQERDMRQLQINKAGHVARARRYREDEQFLAVDPRDPDIARAKQLQMASRVRTRNARRESTT